MGMMVMLLLLLVIMIMRKRRRRRNCLSDDLMLASEPVCFPLPAPADTFDMEVPYSN